VGHAAHSLATPHGALDARRDQVGDEQARDERPIRLGVLHRLAEEGVSRRTLRRELGVGRGVVKHVILGVVDTSAARGLHQHEEAPSLNKPREEVAIWVERVGRIHREHGGRAEETGVDGLDLEAHRAAHEGECVVRVHARIRRQSRPRGRGR
jgi:hypothetical protein